jgi:hypothetical protein
MSLLISAYLYLTSTLSLGENIAPVEKWWEVSCQQSTGPETVGLKSAEELAFALGQML